jgi:hypothetical protein
MLLEFVLKLQLELKESFEALRQETSSVRRPATTNCEFRGALSPGIR